ncbi:hypothetical protein [Uliginosibacterium gangwonense]|nr:hypothetical protein [Uliginosibacterium gangwonense]
MVNISSMMTEWFATLASKLCGSRHDDDAEDFSSASQEARFFEGDN